MPLTLVESDDGAGDGTVTAGTSPVFSAAKHGSPWAGVTRRPGAVQLISSG